MLLATGLLAWALLPGTPVLAGNLPATGQTMAYKADKNNGVGLDAVPDDGTLQRGAALHYKALEDGTIKDLNTGLIWEVKCSGCGGRRHDVDNAYLWSGDGLRETIWDWLDGINAEEGGTGYAGRNDWRIPNVRELQSIVDYGLFNPSIDPIFGPTRGSGYWSSTTNAGDPSGAWGVDFGSGSVDVFDLKFDPTLVVRAVRGGPK